MSIEELLQQFIGFNRLFWFKNNILDERMSVMEGFLLRVINVVNVVQF